MFKWAKRNEKRKENTWKEERECREPAPEELIDWDGIFQRVMEEVKAKSREENCHFERKSIDG